MAPRAKAVELAPEKALYLEEQEHVLEAKGESVQKRYDYVLDLLENCYLPTREGVASFHEV